MLSCDWPFAALELAAVWRIAVACAAKPCPGEICASGRTNGWTCPGPLLRSAKIVEARNSSGCTVGFGSGRFDPSLPKLRHNIAPVKGREERSIPHAFRGVSFSLSFWGRKPLLDPQENRARWLCSPPKPPGGADLQRTKRTYQWWPNRSAGYRFCCSAQSRCSKHMYPNAYNRYRTSDAMHTVRMG